MISKDEYPRYKAWLRRVAEFKDFTDDQFDYLTDQMQVKTFAKGQILFDQGDMRDRYYFMISGLVRTERLDDTGNFGFLSYIKEKKGFPYRGLFQDEEYAYSAEAMTSIEIISFPMSKFEAVIQENQLATKRVIQEMGQIINRNEDQLQRMVISSATKRVEQALEIFSEQLGEPKANGETYVPYPITLIELARVSGTTRETASRAVQKLISDGLISYQHKNFTFFGETLA
ncbi:HTH-type transcriptional regulator ArcR [Secundilactobacillus oryzae JCM 18671]|uniref:HTH-type transcriptional regulator ArcR n=1 Tax=Secundilactobacillus oryzae JCM 18671 TaxID=1291743 RepID=A0A081BGP4_9LACO|nr:Crp/Fnr family transcriptional regulator [Secundilactobacillus oryzae]GAK47212.1 HTH-type transcriptional regulator ArcR [Secundilactobacillus oryzae JCM 18671]